MDNEIRSGLGNVMKCLQFSNRAAVCVGWKDNPVRIESPKMGWRQPRRRLCPPRVGSLSHLIPGSTQVLSMDYGLVCHQVPSHCGTVLHWRQQAHSGRHSHRVSSMTAS